MLEQKSTTIVYQVRDTAIFITNLKTEIVDLWWWEFGKYTGAKVTSQSICLLDLVTHLADYELKLDEGKNDLRN